MKRIILALAAFTLLGGGLFLGAERASASSSSADCNVVRWYNSTGGLVCYDKSQADFSIWTPGGWWGQFPSNGGATNLATGVRTGWHVSNSTTTAASGSFISVQQNCANYLNVVCVYGGNHDYLEWFAASGYVLHVAP